MATISLWKCDFCKSIGGGETEGIGVMGDGCSGACGGGKSVMGTVIGWLFSTGDDFLEAGTDEVGVCTTSGVRGGSIDCCGTGLPRPPLEPIEGGYVCFGGE